MQPRRPSPEPPLDRFYTCPLHPEVEQVAPGKCPTCLQELVLGEGVPQPTQPAA
jgi:Cu+-exporting ATPase